jgi:hypothetical protein
MCFVTVRTTKQRLPPALPGPFAQNGDGSKRTKRRASTDSKGTEEPRMDPAISSAGRCIVRNEAVAWDAANMVLANTESRHLSAGR